MLPLFSLIATSWNIVEKIWAIDSRVHIVAVISSACVQLRQLPLIISFLALALDRVDISMSLNVFGGSSANAARSLLPHCFLFSEHSSVGPRAQISSKNPPTATEMPLLLALEKSAEHHSNNRGFRFTFTPTLHYTALVCVELHPMYRPFI